MLEMVNILLNDKRAELIAPLIERAGFSRDEARAFLPPAIERISGALDNGSLDLGALLRGGSADAARAIDPGVVAEKAGIDEAKARSGLEAMLPTVLSLLTDRAGGAGGIASLLSTRNEGAANGLRGWAGRLFGR